MLEDLKEILLSKVALMSYVIVGIASFMRFYELIPNPVLEDIFVRFIPSIGIFLIAFIAENDLVLGGDEDFDYDLWGISGILILEICAFLFILFLIGIYGIFHFIGLVPNLTYELPGVKMLTDIYIITGTFIGLIVFFTGIAILTIIRRK